MTLLCPGLKATQKMVDICVEYGQEYGVTYNAKKTVCMAFDRMKDRSAELNEVSNKNGRPESSVEEMCEASWKLCGL